MAYNSISIKPYIKSHLELQREITLIELAPSPYFFVLSICLAYMNMFARFDENPAMTLQDIKEKRYGRTHAHRQSENSIPTTNKVCGGYNDRGGGGIITGKLKGCTYKMIHILAFNCLIEANLVPYNTA